MKKLERQEVERSEMSRKGKGSREGEEEGRMEREKWMNGTQKGRKESIISVVY